MENKDDRTMVLAPLKALLKSKRFWTMIFTAIASVLVAIVPELNSAQDALLAVLLGLGSVLVGGYSLEDAFAQRSKE